MTPTLDKSAKLVLVTAALFTAVGYLARSWPLAVIGEAPVFALLGALLAFYPSLLMLRRRRVELLWWIPGGEEARNTRIVDQPFTVRIVVRNKGFADVYAGKIHLLGGSALALAAPEEAGGFVVPRMAEVAFDLPLVAKSAGHWQLHGASLEVRAPFGLFSTQVYFPNPLELTVLPQLLAPRGALSYRPSFGALQARSGAHFVRRAGIGTELREIREHAPGDSFKQIEWKASARLSKLMSREFENEISIEARVLVDASPTMREGPTGRAPLDHAIALSGALARVLLDGRDRVGLITYDTRVISQLKPGEGAAHLTQYLGALLELKRVVDEDLCAIDDPELVSLVARYLAYQEGISAKARAGAQAGSVVLGSDGISYDLFRMTRSIEQLLAEAREEGGRPLDGLPKARDPRLALLRQLCRVRGIELPYRRSLPSDLDRGQVLANVLTQAVASGKGSTLLIALTDLRHVRDLAALTRAVALAKRRHHRLVVVCPSQRADRVGAAQDLLAYDQARARRDVVKALQTLGVPVIVSSPDESLPSLLRRVLAAKRP